jgi:pSer/pThr/pTyr-binding forkhead associated (FHA) protein
MVGCPNGHIYESVLGRCPYDQPAYTPSPPAPPVPVINDQPLPRQTIETKKLANAWLVSGEGHNYQLNQGITSIGRSSQNDIQLADMGISKMHARIHEENGHFRILDVGSTYGVYINSHRIRQETMLESGDSIKLSDNTTVQFVTAPR